MSYFVVKMHNYIEERDFNLLSLAPTVKAAVADSVKSVPDSYALHVILFTDVHGTMVRTSWNV